MIASDKVQFDETGPTISEADISRFERRFDVKLPRDYRAFLLTINGGRPCPDGFRLNWNGKALDWRVHYFFGVNEPEDSCNLDWVNSIVRSKAPRDMIAMASDEAGNYFYVRASEDWSPVYFGPTPNDGEGVGLHLVAESFEEFLSLLRPT